MATESVDDLKNKLKKLPLEFLHGVPVNLTDDMTTQIVELCGAYYARECARKMLEIIDRGSEADSTKFEAQLDDSTRVFRHGRQALRAELRAAIQEGGGIAR